ncbi:outer membrane lipoprotein LolB [Shewanella sp. SR43-4]|uniref:Outer-membrane lipoprotein LolB n=1 Tax=Shewanella vesiculosa TaxID=518738 RepID=A0ABV0FNU3_9GAMM|nr:MULTISPECIES: lipoprotein insertase outer membrane protein LolB [Shewanella]NCQ46680.1 outer membrane lipoprotein LolB [Shewanella frigidimarina]MBB1319224.1 outer membrane lipoprotein LolB [Shewanella sp. SR43-4]MBB1474064.1 outer membrane lipoprotein LolB [Shewanella sp. SG41-3]NCO71331.1 outer membrane lipoprotein LolB [Shewanella vesiculosa]NCP37809.1 outer membrane lipoprotein LolB [Shewanella vesiculosa]
MRLSASFFYTAIITALLLLTGCSVTPSEDFTPINVTNAAQANAWELQGKIAVKTAEDKFSTNLYWLHQPAANDLRLTTVLGTTVLTLKTNQGMATLEVDGKTYRDSNAQDLLTGISGWSIPLDSLPLWITGQIGSNDKIVSYNPDGTIKQVISYDPQANWSVSFLSWQQQSGALVPKLLKIERENVQIKIQTNQWTAVAAKTQ